MGCAEHDVDDCQDANFLFFVRLALACLVQLLPGAITWFRTDDTLDLVANTTIGGSVGGGGDQSSTWCIAIARTFYLDKFRLPGDGVVVTHGKSITGESNGGWELPGIADFKHTINGSIKVMWVGEKGVKGQPINMNQSNKENKTKVKTLTFITIL